MEKKMEIREIFTQDAEGRSSSVEGQMPDLSNSNHITPVLNMPEGSAVYGEDESERGGPVSIPVITPVMEIIRQRRSVGQMSQEQPTRAQIERILEAATYAPNHRVTEPWHFFVLTGTARERLGEIMEESLRLRLLGDGALPTQEQLRKERMKPGRAPVIIAVALKDVRQMAGELIENVEATAAAVQNMLLAATEMGLATIWRTRRSYCRVCLCRLF
jgi:hypothetical protein